MNNIKKAFQIMTKWVTLVLGLSLLVVSVAHASDAPVTFSSISQNIGSAVTGLSRILEDVALVAGIGFIMVSFFKFHQHKMNPTQIPMSQGITLLVIGAALTVFPHLIETPGTALLGNSAKVSQLSSNAITGVIGSAGQG